MKSKIKEYLIMTFGCILLAISIACVLIPCKIGIGGATGIATSFNALFGIKVGLCTILINIPLFAMSYHLIGLSFTIKTAYLVVLSSLIIDFLSILPIKPLDDILLASILCGVLMGVGMALIFMAGGSTGGLDILAKAINNKYPSISISSILLVEDILVYLLIAYVFGIESVLYAFVMSTARSKTMDIVQEGIYSKKQCMIICDRHEQITYAIQSQLARGVTLLNATGGYSNTEKKVIYVVIQRKQLNHLKRIIKEIEPTAFTTVSSVTDIVGLYRQESSI